MRQICVKLVALRVQQGVLTELKLRLHQNYDSGGEWSYAFLFSIYTEVMWPVGMSPQSSSLLHYSDTTFGGSSYMFAETILADKDITMIQW